MLLLCEFCFPTFVLRRACLVYFHRSDALFYQAVQAALVYEPLLVWRRQGLTQPVSLNYSQLEVTQSRHRSVSPVIHPFLILIVMARAVSMLLLECVCLSICTGLLLTSCKNMTEDDWRWHMYDTVRPVRRRTHHPHIRIYRLSHRSKVQTGSVTRTQFII